MVFFVTNRYGNLWGVGDVFIVVLRNAMNVFWQKILLFMRSISMEKKPKNINDKRMSKIRPSVLVVYSFVYFLLNLYIRTNRKDNFQPSC